MTRPSAPPRPHLHITASSRIPAAGRLLRVSLAETWNTLDYLAEAGIRYVCDWVNDDQLYLFEIARRAE